MKIAYYIHHSNLKAGGIFTYSIGVLKLLIDEPEIETIYIVHSENQKSYLKSNFQHEKIKLFEIQRESKINKIRFSFSYFLFDFYSIYKEYSHSILLKFISKLSLVLNPYRSISKLPIQVLHVPMQFSPIYNIKVPVITTLHDVQELHLPENFSAAERLHRAINTKKAIENSNHIIVSFDHIKKDIVNNFQISSTSVSVCPPPFHENWFGTVEKTEEIKLKEKHNLPDSFLLYPASTWVHKNHLNLIFALHHLHQKGIKPSLVCTGNQTPYFENTLKPKIQELGLTDYVLFLGIVSEEDLNALYAQTSLVVIPTKYEAGSAPLYEAMRLGAPVICSNTTSLPETMKNKEFIFDPENIQELTGLLELGINDKGFIKRNLENAKERINALSEVNYANQFLDCYKKLVNHKS